MNWNELVAEIKENVVTGVVDFTVVDSKVIKNDKGTFIIFKLSTEDGRKFDVCYTAQINFMNTIQKFGEAQDSGELLTGDVTFDGKYFNVRLVESTLLG